MSLIIKSKENPQYRCMLSLGTKKGRDRENAFVIEGERFVREAITHCRILHVAVSESYAEKNQSVMEDIPHERRVVLTDALFNALSGTEHTGGILAVCAKPQVSADIYGLAKTDRLYLLVEDINDPGNLGAIIRAADAAGADAVILSKGCVELYNPKVLRGSAGSVFHLPIVENADLAEAITQLKSNGVAVYASHLSGAAFPYGLDLRGNCAFIVGNEARGLSRCVAALADAYVKLPMVGGAESLNAAVAAGVLLYEAVRQRVAEETGNA